jgi:hypothetical protein
MSGSRRQTAPRVQHEDASPYVGRGGLRTPLQTKCYKYERRPRPDFNCRCGNAKFSRLVRECQVLPSPAAVPRSPVSCGNGEFSRLVREWQVLPSPSCIKYRLNDPIMNEPSGSTKCWGAVEWLHNRCPSSGTQLRREKKTSVAFSP